MASLQWKGKRAYAVHFQRGEARRLKWIPLGRFERKIEGQVAFENHLLHAAGGAAKPVLFEDILPKYLEFARATKAATTYRGEANHAQVLENVFGPLRLTEIDGERVEKWRTAHAWAKTTWSIRLTLLKKILEYGKGKGFAVADPFAVVKIPRVRISEMEPRAVAIEIVDAVIALLPEKYRALAMIQRFTGMRPCEVRRLKLEDIRRRPDALPARAKRQARMIPVRDDIRPFLIPEHIPVRVTEAAYHKALVKASKSAGYPGAVTAYVIRHSAATRALDVTGDLRAVQQVLGHARVEMTARYAHASEKRKADAVAAF